MYWTCEEVSIANGQSVVRILERLSETRGLHRAIVVDNSPELISKARPKNSLLARRERLKQRPYVGLAL